jgi:hypothetical protein
MEFDKILLILIMEESIRVLFQNYKFIDNPNMVNPILFILKTTTSITLIKGKR